MMIIGGKKAVVVGGASGMAKASAAMLRERGASIAILDLPTSAGAEVAAELGGTFHPADITDFEGVAVVLNEAVEALGVLHIAVNTAGGGIAMRTLGKHGLHPLDEFASALTKDAAFPKRMGRPDEYGRLVVAIVETAMLNGSCIRLDGGQHVAPR